jgi:ABC-type glycerol-3-phosphate transport system permease component
VVTNREHLMMISQGLTVFQGQLTGTAYNLLMAGSLIAVVPVLIVAMFAQRKVVEGLTLGAIR